MDLDSIFNNYIGRIVAFALAPLLLVAVPPVTNAVNEVLGTGYSDQQISNIAIGISVGLAAVIWQWLRNRGNWEKGIAELDALYKSGQQLVESQEGQLITPEDVPPPPEGPSSSALGINKGQ